MGRLEGNEYSRLNQLIKGDNKRPTTITNATVRNMSPLSIRIEDETIDTPYEGLIVNDDLLTHTRRMRVAGGAWQSYEVESPLKVGDRVIVAITNDDQLVYVIAKAAL